VSNFDIQLRLEGKTIVPRGAKSRIVFEKPVPAFPNKRRLSAARRSVSEASDACGATAISGVATVQVPDGTPKEAVHGASAATQFSRPPLLPAISEGGASAMDDDDSGSSRAVNALNSDVNAHQDSVAENVAAKQQASPPRPISATADVKEVANGEVQLTSAERPGLSSPDSSVPAVSVPASLDTVSPIAVTIATVDDVSARGVPVSSAAVHPQADAVTAACS
jgi:hypothetical protein